jgi:hypothetical protein
MLNTVTNGYIHRSAIRRPYAGVGVKSRPFGKVLFVGKVVNATAQLKITQEVNTHIKIPHLMLVLVLPTATLPFT